MFLRSLFLVILLPMFAFAGGFEQRTKERENLEQVIELLEGTPSTVATHIAWRIRQTLDTADNDLGVHDTKDYFGEFNAEGRTFRWMETTIRADRAQSNRAFDMTGSNMRDYRKGLDLMNVMVHEMFHYEDYVNNGGRGSSPESETYPRGHKLMYTVLDFKVFKEYIIALKNNEGSLDLKRNRAITFMHMMARELHSYDSAEHGKYKEKDLKPLHVGNTCWRPLKRAEAANYLMSAKNIIKASNKSYQQIIDDLENLINYSYPGKIGKHCVKDSPVRGQLNNQDPVGKHGPRTHQKMYKLRLNASGHHLVLEKTSVYKKFKIEISSAGAVSGGVKTLRYDGTLYSFNNTFDTYLGRGGEKILTLSGDLSKPTAFNAYAYYYDDNNNKVSYNVGLTPISNADQAAYGFHPIYETNNDLIFDAQSVSALGRDNRFEAIEFLAKKDDHIHISMPQIDGRSGTLYRLSGQTYANGLPELKYVASLYSFETTLSRYLSEAGRYILYVERDSDYLGYNRNIKLNFQLSRSDKDGPTLADAKVMTPQRFAAFGNHTPFVQSYGLTLSQADTQRIHYPFHWHKVIDLKTIKGDIIHFSDPHINDDRVAIFMKRDASGFKEVSRVYAFQSGAEVRIQDDLPHYLVYANNSAHRSSRVLGMTLSKFHFGVKAPSTNAPLLVDNATQANFNIYPIRDIKDKVIFDQSTSRGLIYGNQFRLITFNVPSDGKFYFYNSSNFIKRRFVLFKVDETKFAANQPSLRDIHRSYSWDASFAKDLKPGKYALAIESEDPAVGVGDAFFKMSISLQGSNPTTIQYQKVSNGQALMRKYEVMPIPNP